MQECNFSTLLSHEADHLAQYFHKFFFCLYNQMKPGLETPVCRTERGEEEKTREEAEGDKLREEGKRELI